MITRNNYEEFFLLYADNELSATDKKAVEEFVLQNPDLENELLMVQQSILKPDNAVVFENKEVLLKKIFSNSIINETNYEEYFLLYADNELDKAARKDVELFASQNPSMNEELNILLQTKPVPDTEIKFEGKEVLYKREKNDKVIPLSWLRIAAAAIVLLLVGVFIFNNRTHTTGTVAKTRETKIKSKDISTENKKEQTAVTSATVVPLNITEDTKMAMTGKQKIANKKLPGYAVNNQSKKQVINNIKGSVTDGNDENKPTVINKNDIAEVEKPKNETGANKSIINTVPNTLVAKANNPVAAATVNNNDEINYVQQAIQKDNAPNADEVFYVANTSSKKNKLRGLFRKVSRVFDKTVNADDDNKHGVLIGGFQITLK